MATISSFHGEGHRPFLTQGKEAEDIDARRVPAQAAGLQASMARRLTHRPDAPRRPGFSADFPDARPTTLRTCIIFSSCRDGAVKMKGLRSGSIRRR
jgi:hypothetical protein